MKLDKLAGEIALWDKFDKIDERKDMADKNSRISKALKAHWIWGKQLNIMINK
jgi:hypothetical protein